MKLINDRKVYTRLDPGKGTGSVLDLAIVSANIEESVTHFTVDSERKKTAFAMVKKTNNIIEKKFTDHFTINLKLKIPTRTYTKGKKKKIINMKNKEGWLLYPEITDRHASEIVTKYSKWRLSPRPPMMSHPPPKRPRGPTTRPLTSPTRPSLP